MPRSPNILWLSSLALLFAAGSVGAVPLPGPHLPPPPCCGAAPLLYVRFVGPAEMRGTVFRGAFQGEELHAPFLLGLRPGYIYRIQLNGFPNDPELVLYPSLQVIGSLAVPPKFKSADHPAPVVLSERDIDKIKGGAVITKVIFIEDPYRAAPVATNRDQPLEIEAPPNLDPLKVAREQGRPVLIVRVGGKLVSPQEMVAQAVFGTMLLSYDRFLPPPARPPFFPFAGVPIHDPFLGPKCSEVECVHDGGDGGLPAGIGPGNQAGNVDPGDTVGEYTTSHGKRRLACSNRVCLCAPRYVVVRSEIIPVGAEMVAGVLVRKKLLPQYQYAVRVPPLETLQQKQLEGYHGSLKPSANINSERLENVIQRKVLYAVEVDTGLGELLGTKKVRELSAEQRTRLVQQIEVVRLLGRRYGTEYVDQVIGPRVLGQVKGLGLVTAVVEVRDVTIGCEEEPCPPEKPLCLYKWADCHAVQVGDTVTFFIKYSNQGGQPISDVAVIDSLTGRLEYVPGSAQSNRDAVFTVRENAAGSLLLRWEVAGVLPPGESGVVRFQAKIR